jgi:hypothetical protein
MAVKTLINWLKCLSLQNIEGENTRKQVAEKTRRQEIKNPQK